ncbi:anthranilate synthase component I family protein [Chengkuizengella axinellae]|uniref:Anthranilate synthase component I family protein n=1 Tax=Chengkuizengella axinellae TaxID=3064388 RepID=A0ABT9J5S2_9BACL|nr:anthranilate synthase component I family protein [Chengkuizengella sp. 2205SS18-9]MDP5276970.1 anthranilate synthase component I family protein [Chengkuizengella sp. 2205SS18-9]
MILTSLEQWKQWKSEYTMLPYVQAFPLANIEVLSWEKAWESSSDYAFVLESGKTGNYTFLGLRPFSTIYGKDQKGVISDQNNKTIHVQGKPLDLVKNWMKDYVSPKVKDAPKFIGGCVGYWSYDVIRSIEKIPNLSEEDLELPDYYFMMMDELWIIDQKNECLYCAVHTPISTSFVNEDILRTIYQNASEKVQQMKKVWDDIITSQENEPAKQRKEIYAASVGEEQLHIDVESIAGVEKAFAKKDYMDAVKRIQEYIAQGDIFQVNLSLRQSRRINSSPEELYEWLRILNPSPYMSYMKCPEFHLVSASPELLVKVEDGIVSTRPIAGTRRRGITDSEDKKLAEELIMNEKERAEHVMLVDLERNDLGRISTFGTVKVKDFMEIEYYSHVMHLVSEVQGKLAEGKDTYDVIAATFPGGTITGAPKIRTMEIIEELEPVRRGPYTGSIGWIDYNGNMEFNIIIRTLVVKDQIGYIQAGAGIVIDSDPYREYKESLNKAKALWKAIQYSELIHQV